MAATIWDYTLMPPLLPLLVAYWAIAFLLSWLITFTVIPSVILSRRLYWACPFIPHIWRKFGGIMGWYMRIGFEASYCINMCTRLLTLPMRPYLPSFYIVGFPKCGTTSLAEHLKRHPALSGTVGLPYHETLSKESHYFAGVLGRNCAHSARLYRSFFPTVLQRWWSEAVLRVDKWMCFDACPVHACLPYVAKRIAAVTPHAKIIVMAREPSSGVFSAETMLRNMGVPLLWSLTEPLRPDDGRFKVSKEDQALWDRLAHLGTTESLPHKMPETFYFRLASHLQCGKYAELLQPYLELFPPENIMVISFSDFLANTEQVVNDVLMFVGANPLLYKYKKLPPAMQNDYKGRQLHPTVKARLQQYYHASNQKLYALLNRDMGWEDMEAPPAG